MKQSSCQFCQFGKNDPTLLFENSSCFIKLSINPQTKGHALVIPKYHYQSLAELKDQLVLGLFRESIRIGELLKQRLKAKAYIIRVNNELFKLELNSGHIGHIHIHVIPRYKANERVLIRPKRARKDVLLKIRQQILFKDQG